ncbi:hypothetical protein QJS04_geneDACA020888 [Acorus gramineus]|uniref:Uncharacterized protein n=1 Tax=Acorus gramineus TaxID=55184 RepID=A0AAV9B1R4_ACOGR|nr:hypothetical protein QJS04_geneDACA020888 [Acorus gramineus]
MGSITSTQYEHKFLRLFFISKESSQRDEKFLVAVSVMLCGSHENFVGHERTRKNKDGPTILDNGRVQVWFTFLKFLGNSNYDGKGGDVVLEWFLVAVSVMLCGSHENFVGHERTRKNKESARKYRREKVLMALYDIRACTWAAISKAVYSTLIISGPERVEFYFVSVLGMQVAKEYIWDGHILMRRNGLKVELVSDENERIFGQA